jgi:hypothetical protein
MLRATIKNTKSVIAQAQCRYNPGAPAILSPNVIDFTITHTNTIMRWVVLDILGLVEFI